MGGLDTPANLASQTELDELVRDASLPVLVDFWAPWCGPCRMVAPELEKLAKDLSGKLIVAKLNTDESPGATGRFNISGIPTMILFRDGREATRISGAMRAPELRARLGL